MAVIDTQKLSIEFHRLILHPQRQKWAKAVQAGGEIKYPINPSRSRPTFWTSI